MPSTSLSGVRKLLGYASALFGSATRGQLTQTWAWNTFRAAQTAAGETVTGVSASDMSKMISWVNKATSARDSFALAPGTATITDSMISPYATYVLSPGVAESPRTAVQLTFRYTSTGELVTEIRWMELPVTGLTKDALLTLITQALTTKTAEVAYTLGPTVTVDTVVTLTIFRI